MWLLLEKNDKQIPNVRNYLVETCCTMNTKGKIDHSLEEYLSM